MKHQSPWQRQASADECPATEQRHNLQSKGQAYVLLVFSNCLHARRMHGAEKA